MHIVHRDITPSNVMVSWGDAVKLTDFGLSRHFGTAELLRSCVGTLMYSCPELASGQGYTEKADIWAAGCLLYQMVALQPPFVSSNALALVKRIMEGDYPPLPSSYSQLLHDAVATCLRVNTEERPDITRLCALISERIVARLDMLQERNLRLERQALTARQARARGGGGDGLRPPLSMGGNLGASIGSDMSSLSATPGTGLGSVGAVGRALPRYNSSSSAPDAEDDLLESSSAESHLVTPGNTHGVRLPSGQSWDDEESIGALPAAGTLSASSGALTLAPQVLGVGDSAQPRHMRRSLSSPLKPMVPRPGSGSTPPSRPQTSMSNHRRMRRYLLQGAFLRWMYKKSRFQYVLKSDNAYIYYYCKGESERERKKKKKKKKIETNRERERKREHTFR